MTTSTLQPGLRAVARPIAHIGGHPVYPLQGGRSGVIRIAVGDDEGSDDDILDDDRDEDDEDDDEGDEEPEEELPASMRGKRQATKAQPRKRTTRRTADDEDQDSDEQDEGDDTPAALRRMEEALGKANRTAARHRRAGKVMERLGIEDLPTWLAERGIDPETGLPYGDDVVDPEDDGADDELLDDFDDRRRSDREDSRRRDRETTRQIRATRERAERDARDKYVPLLAQLEATNALRAAGFNGSKAREERLLRMIDPTQLDVIVEDDEFEIQGLDEQVAELVDEFPELFTKREARTTDRRGTATRTSPARRASGARDVDGGERGRPARKTGGWLDQVAAEMDRRGR